MTREAPFAELYATHYRQVRALCRQLLGSAERADDATQEAFVRAYRNFAGYDAAQPFGPWIMRIARNHALDLLRRRRLEPAELGTEAEEAAAAEAGETDGLGELLTAERAGAVQAAVAALPERYRVPLALAYFADLRYDEIATDLGITRTHVGALLCRARQLLRKMLTEETES
ncbi:MAG TPA: sigma-70 family RNA polymerase sigma factor [Gammaproteobacteria bacterium]|jgi:RNA polymerase sigma-70 factor (ECF subfamily)|nr:sigma-70 family RNA polymerase sigma factor [Gammaproteobacteria bacterium]